MGNKEIISYYNKFCENKRLESRHGQVEFFVATKYIEKFAKDLTNKTLLDVGAGTGRYSIWAKKKGANVTAVELVKYNLGILKTNDSSIKAIEGDARNLKKIKNDSFDIVLLFGPLYHILSYDEKLVALNEAKRVVKPNGLIFISYLNNEYAILKHGFMDGNLTSEINNGRVDKKFKTTALSEDLYSYVDISIIKKLSKDARLKRIKMVAQDGLTDYIRDSINKLTEDEFELYKQYVLSRSSDPTMLGFSSHILDILTK